jgi:ElaB/YqjD/DUF883 family membrane-anchored ribosome-binding protein
VPSFPSFLDRFRRLLAPPGRPGEALGVPAAGDDLHGELEPLFEQLDTVDAIAQARERHAQAQAQVDAILEQARRRAEEERARAAHEQRAEVARRTVEMHEASRREAERIGTVREDRVAELVSEVLECVRHSGR